MPTSNTMGFVDHYAPANWAFNPGSGNGSVDTSGVPNSITITGSTNNIADPTDYYMFMPMDPGDVSFDYNYQSTDTAGFDAFGYTVNNTFTQLADTNGTIGSIIFQLAAGDTFGFRLTTLDGQGGPAMVTISNFSGPSAPLAESPAPLPFLGAAAAYSWSRRLRRRALQPLAPLAPAD